jgi:hypothetical protein
VKILTGEERMAVKLQIKKSCRRISPGETTGWLDSEEWVQILMTA